MSCPECLDIDACDDCKVGLCHICCECDECPNNVLYQTKGMHTKEERLIENV